MVALPPFPADLPGGYRFRACAGPSDAAAFAAIHSARAGLDGVDPLGAREMVATREEYAEALAASAADATLGFRPVIERDGEVVAFGKLEGWKELDGTSVRLVLGWTHPAHRGRGLGSALVAWEEAAALALERSEYPGGKAELAANASSTERSATELLLAAGYRPAYTVAELRLDPEEFRRAIRTRPPAPPIGFAVSAPAAADLPGMATAVLEAYAEEYPGGRYAEPYDPAAWAEEAAGRESEWPAWRVARSGGEIAGVVVAGLGEDRAELEEVSVRPAFRRRGLARALLVDTLEELLERGPIEIRVCTDDGFRTRAIELYRSLGFRPVKEHPRYRKPMPAR